MTQLIPIKYRPDLMDDPKRSAIMAAMHRLLYSEHLQEVWPGLYDLFNLRTDDCPRSQGKIELVLLPLDRIGAPAGASGASVYVAYFSLQSDGNGTRPVSSPPLVIKIGEHEKLKGEIEIESKWPTLTLDVRANFALPIMLDSNNSEHTILVAPFRSTFNPDHTGGRHGVRLTDLFGLLDNKDELIETSSERWAKVTRYISHALDSMDYIHRGNHAQYQRCKKSYSEAYEWYTRDIFKDESKKKMLSHLFGDADEVTMFGKQWRNPNIIARKIIESKVEFDGTFGAVHGDLHPKNIVLGQNDSVRIIDFGWVSKFQHVIVDYLLLDINLRCTTLPSQLSGSDIAAIGGFLDWDADISVDHPSLNERVKIIKNVIWARLHQKKLVSTWRDEYIIPFFLVGYGLLLFLDSTRNQAALLTTVLSAAEKIGDL